MISIVLADDHHIVRQGLRALLEAESDFRVIGEASNGRDAIELVRKLHPSVLVLDLMMPVLNGIEVTRQLGKAHLSTKIVILSMYANEAYVLETLANGASAYVLKDSNTSDLVQAVREVAIGRRYLSPPLSDRAIEAYQEKARSASLDKYETLTTREREILQLAAEGSSSTDIA
ncbi:MAG TPA: response regulator transcription factor, partial [Acidobacteriota bacterium]|nr:response regulator transcription factor [Acidobacteriota bacterium]HNH81986.1 response regulator transcription factor [Acidobacteriota bacterium]